MLFLHSLVRFYNYCCQGCGDQLCPASVDAMNQCFLFFLSVQLGEWDWLGRVAELFRFHSLTVF